MNAGADTSDPPVGGAASACLSKGADHKQSGASKEMRQGTEWKWGLQGTGNWHWAFLGRANRQQWRAVPGVPTGQHLPRDQQHVPGRAPMHTTETHGDQQHPADLPRASHGGGSSLTPTPAPGPAVTRAAETAPRPRSRVHKGPAQAPPRSRSPSLSGFCRPAAETTGNPELQRQQEIRSSGVR